MRSDDAPSVSRAIGSRVQPSSGIVAVSMSDRLSRTACPDASVFSAAAEIAAPATKNAAQHVVRVVHGLQTVASYAMGAGGVPTLRPAR